MSSATVITPRRSVIHPRFRARRIEVKRDAGRRRLRRLVALGVLVALLVIAYGVTRSPLLDLDHVRITGTAHTDPAAAIAAAGLRTGQPMTDVDIDRARRAIEALPWVDTVSITRHWPGTVAVAVTERRGVAALKLDEGTWLLLDPTGRVLETRTTAPADLAVLTGVAATAGPGETVPEALPGIALAGYITADLRAWFVEVVVNPDATLDAKLHNGIRVSFGSQAHLADKMIGLATVLTRVDLKDLDHVDLQVPNSPVLTRRGFSA